MFESAVLLRTLSKSILGITALLLSAHSSQAEIVLRIDSATKTFQWLGSYSTGSLSLDPGQGISLSLGTGSYILYAGSNSTGTGSLNVTEMGDWFNCYPMNPGDLQVNSSSVHSYIGDAWNYSEDPVSFSLNIEGDGTVYSYAIFESEPGLESLLLSFGEESLYLWVSESPTLVGKVEVIPEPTLAWLLLPGMGLLWAARSRNKA